MLDSSIGNVVLTGLFGMFTNKTYIKFDGDLYLGFLTKLPNANGAPYEDGTYFSEPSDSSYLRIKINTDSRITKTKFIAPAENDIVGDEAGPVCVKNQSLIMFPEATTKYDIVGFGIFRNNDVGDQTLPFLWGAVTNEQGTSGVTINPEEVPIIRAGGFKISLA